MKYQHQIDETDCGPACIVMAASHYNLYTTIGRVRELTKTDFIGTNLKGMANAAEKLGFSVNIMKGVLNEATLNGKIICPFIAHVRVPYHDTMLDHFVVVSEITRSLIKIWDPDSSRMSGKYTLSHSEFLKIWTGYVLFLSPGAQFVPEKGERRILLKYLPLAIPHKKTLVIMSLSSALLIVFGIVTSYYYKHITDEVVIANAAFTLAAFSIGVILVTFTQSVVEALRSVLINHLAFKVDLQLNFSYITHILKLPLSFFDSRKTGEIISRLNDISKIREMLTGTALSLVFDCVLIVITGPILFKTNSKLFAIAIFNIILMSIIIFFFSKVFKKQYGKLRKEEAEVNSSLVEAISGAYTVKALNAEKVIGDIYEKKQMQAVWTGWKTASLGVWQRFFAGLINGVTAIVIFWVGSKGIIDGNFSFGTLLSFNSLLGYFTGPLFRMINIQPQLQEASIAAERVAEILEIEPEQSGEQKLLKLEKVEGAVVFEHVAFKYGMRPLVYQDLNFQIHKGQRIAFVGQSGCGKTTLVKLLLKFYLPESGSVFIDGHNIQDIDAVTLRSKIGYVPQDVFVFAGTIAENIALRNPDASLDEIIEAAKRAGADEFISNLPERYNTRLSERGSTLSGGERQRLALARALLGNPDMLILDEATSSLDSMSERLVHQAIDNLGHDVTTVIIAHRLTTVTSCDVIFVMEKGGIVESGSHKELLAKGGLYASLWKGMAV